MIDRESMTVINLMDNEAMFDVFDSFAPAPPPNVDHETAFDKMVPYITLDPVYVYDKELKKYILCGLLDSEQAVDAVTGELWSYGIYKFWNKVRGDLLWQEQL